MDLKEEIRATIADMLEMEAEELDCGALFSEYGMDSFIAMQLIAMLESEYDITVPDEFIKSFKTVNDTVRIVEELRK